MNNTYSLKLFDTTDDSKFPNNNLDLWIAHSEFEAFKKKYSKDDSLPIYVTLKSGEVLKPFTVHAVLQSLNQKSTLPATDIFISKNVKHSDWLMENNTKVVISPIDESEIKSAEAITIKFNKSQVQSWSEEEAKIAASNYKVHNLITYKSQKVWITPGTKKPSLAEVISVIPIPKKEFNAPLAVTDKTKIIFEGLSEQQQAVIDFDKIGGLTDIISKLREIIQVPIQFPEVLKHFDIKPPKGLLLHGPPGNGKTMIARAVSYSMGAKFISIEGPELMSKYVGVAEQQLREKFEEAEKLGDCVIFIDEIDSVAGNRENTTAEHNISIVATLLNLMDGIKSNSRVFVIGATNRLNAVDPALRRPGRFDLELEVPVPNLAARIDILTKYIFSSEDRYIRYININDAFIRILGELTNGFSGADLSALYREAIMNAIRAVLDTKDKTGKIFLKAEPKEIEVKQEHFFAAVKSITPTSLRGLENDWDVVQWEDIIGLISQSQELTRLHRFITKKVDSKLNLRPGFFNMTFSGKKGSGRKTLIRSFASKFNYELLFLDLLKITAKPQLEAFLEIDNVFTKAKQVAPSIIYVLNSQIAESKLLLKKIINDSAKYNFHNKVLVIVEIDSDLSSIDYLKGHKAFNTDINFNTEIAKEDLTTIYNRYQYVLSSLSFDEFVSNYKNRPVGQIIIEFNDKLLLYL